MSSLEQLPDEHPALHLLNKIPNLITNSINPNEVALAIAQKIFKRMYEKVEYDLQIDTHIAILEHLRDVCKKVVKELTNWIIYSEADVRSIQTEGVFLTLTIGSYVIFSEEVPPFHHHRTY